MATKKRLTKPTSSDSNKEIAIPMKVDSMLANIVEPAQQDRFADIPVPTALKDHFKKEAPQGFSPLIAFGDDPENWKPGSWCVAKLLNIRGSIGPNDSNMYDFQITPNGKDFREASLWGSTILDTKFKLLDPKPGDWIFIQYLGTVPTSRKQNPAKDFRLAIVDDAFIKQAGYTS